MKNIYFRTLSKAVNYYTEKGYIFPFDLTEHHGCRSKWTLVQTHRFEGNTDPSDNSILYVLEHKNGLDKGILIDAYGPMHDESINQFLQNVPRQFPDWLTSLESCLSLTIYEQNMRQMISRRNNCIIF